MTKVETRVCECCGRELPVTDFIARHFGASKICKQCNAARIHEAKEKKKANANLEADLLKARSLRLSEFTPRELMEELKRRGYEGKLTYVETHTIDLSSI